MRYGQISLRDLVQIEVYVMAIYNANRKAVNEKANGWQEKTARYLSCT